MFKFNCRSATLRLSIGPKRIQNACHERCLSIDIEYLIVITFEASVACMIFFENTRFNEEGPTGLQLHAYNDSGCFTSTTKRVDQQWNNVPLADDLYQRVNRPNIMIRND